MNQISFRLQAGPSAIFACVLLFLLSLTAQAVDGPIRFKGVMRDAKGIAYTVVISAPDEKVKVESGGGWYSEGDKSMSGHYRAALVAKGKRSAVPQKVALFEGTSGEFKFGGQAGNILKSKTKKQPDILVVEQYWSSNGVTGRVFFIERGNLVAVRFSEGKETWLDQYWSYGQSKSIGNFRFHSIGYDNSEGDYLHSTWKFEPKTRRFRRVKLTKSKNG